ncbi:MAG: HD domain-containing protein [Candidatus Komeilibacteria bacterium]|nr:HD domain-containing protein [Candidatus Komeilibacteria bacterium]
MTTNQDTIEKVDSFVKKAFQKNPHYSFNHWSVMYNHSVNVKNLALKISENINCNKFILSICALLHDIGKTYKTDLETLHKNHEDFNLAVSEDFLKSLNLDHDDFQKISDIITHNSDSVEMKIVEDADALALYFDKTLYMLYIEWALKNELRSAIQRKLDKFNSLNFEISRELGKDKIEQMKQDWGEYQKNNEG